MQSAVLGQVTYTVTPMGEGQVHSKGLGEKNFLPPPPESFKLPLPQHNFTRFSLKYFAPNPPSIPCLAMGLGRGYVRIGVQRHGWTLYI